MQDDDQVDGRLDETGTVGTSRWRLIVGFLGLTTVSALAIAGWFAWQAGNQPQQANVTANDVPLIQAPDGQDRVRPAPDERGGTVVANTDKQIYETFHKKRAPLEPGVERLLPPPETPLPETANGAAPAPDTAPVPEPGYSSDNRNQLTDIVISKRDAVPVPDDETAPAIVKPAIVERSGVPLPRQTLPAKPQQQAKLSPPEKTEKKPSRRIKVDLSEDRGDWRVQLAALRSHDDAIATWKRLAKRHPDLFADRSPVVTGTDLLKKGTYHRLRTGGFESRAEASSFCTKVKARKLECIVIRP